VVYVCASADDQQDDQQEDQQAEERGGDVGMEVVAAWSQKACE
jgi:hypothetical protein